MTVVFPGPDSPEFDAEFRGVIADIADLVALFDAHGVDKTSPRDLDDKVVQSFETVLARFNAVLERVRTMGAYIYAFVSTDSRDNLAQAKRSELEQHTVRLSQLDTRFTAWIGSLDVEVLIERSPLARDHAFALRRAKTEAEHQMSPAEEALATEMNVTGGSAWGRLHGNFTSQLQVPIELDGERRELPMSAVRNLAFDPSRDVRLRAHDAEVQAWERAALPLASALNSIKGEVNTLARRRGWGSALDAALFENNIDRQTLDAMLLAARESFPDFRRYLRAKARMLGVPALAWYDMFAPVGQSTSVWEFDSAAAFVVEQFGTYSPKMGDFAARAVRERWIDAEPRTGKRDGAFCMGLRGDESRILMNFKPNFGSVRTLAHELGHGYHNLNLAPRTPVQSSTPMILAETASIFCETVVRDAGLRRVGPEEQIEILEGALQAACQIVVDITSRFLFEQRVFDQREQRELSIDELNEFMLDAQKQTYGDGLDEASLYPYMWAVKLHYYSTGRSFYNYPYMFGMLFGLGLYARYQAEPEAFKGDYDDLLSSTGLYDPATLAERFGIDIRQPEFWRSSLDVVRADIDRFEALATDSVARSNG
jgi:oligoendopeptidase F